ncbi:MAG: hypothetical protein M8349_00495 [ANME-2 cluster archaeon]|nr:hypothetical protein [ANME-2 cluster archaeon]
MVHSSGCPSRYAPPALVVWVLAGAFRFFLRALGAKWGWMPGWVVGGGGGYALDVGLRMLYSVVDGGVLPGLLKYISI